MHKYHPLSPTNGRKSVALLAAAAVVSGLFCAMCALVWRLRHFHYDATGQTVVNSMAARDPEIMRVLDGLTLRQKIGQMTQVDVSVFLDWQDRVDPEKLRLLTEEWPVGSILNSPQSGLKICPSATVWSKLITTLQDGFVANGPRIPAVYGLDSVHGANYILEATLFPQQINIGASFNLTISKLVGEITAKDTRAIGVQWNFSPIADIAVQPVWPRVYETFGEDPYLASEMVREIIYGMQGFPQTLNDTLHVAATVKHFIGYSASRTNYDRNPVWMPERAMYEYFVPSFRSAIDAGCATAMESYIDVNGVPVCSSERYLKKMLREELQFNGTLVTDWAEIIELHKFHRVAPTLKDALHQVLNKTTIDMSMVPLEYMESMKLMEELVQSGVVPMSRIDESVYRVLELKQQLGLLSGDRDAIYPNEQRIATIGSDEDRKVSLDGALESITLLKNAKNILPIQPGKVKSILLVGPTADCLRCLAGGWSLRHQGAENDDQFQFGSSIKAGLEEEAALHGINVTYMAGTTLEMDRYSSETKEEKEAKEQAMIAAAKSADMVIVALGEGPYAEAPGDISDLRLPPNQLQLVSTLSNAAGKDRMVMVLVEGRPRNLEDKHKEVSGIVLTWLPGLEGGRALAQLLFNRQSFSGRLPMTYPDSLSTAVVPHYRRVTEVYRPLYPFGYGLSYSLVDYSNITVAQQVVRLGADSDAVVATVKVAVTNYGPYRQKHSVLLYGAPVYRTVVPEAQKLLRFTKIELAVDETMEVEFALKRADFEFYGGEDGSIARTVEPGRWYVRVGQLISEFDTVA